MRLSILKKSECDLVLHESYKCAVLDTVLHAMHYSVEFYDSQDIEEIFFSARVNRNKAKKITCFIGSALKSFQNAYVLQKSDLPTEQPLRHNTVDVSEGFVQANGMRNNQIAYVFFPNSAEMTQCTIHVRSTISSDTEICLPRSLKQKSDGQILLLKPVMIVCPTIKNQMARKIKEDTITVNADLYKQLQMLSPYGIELRHLATGATLTRKFSYIEGSSDLKPGEIRLNYYQREILNIVDSQKSNKEPSYIETLRVKVERTSIDSTNYFISDSERLTVTANYNCIQIVPIFDIVPAKYNMLYALCNKFVGKCEMKLSAGRPYKIDDSRDIVRLSEDTMTLLGIEETDRVIIKYKNGVCKASAMRIDTFELMKETNILDSETDLDLIVGIPAPLRQKLGIGDIETEVTVARDTVFLFNKRLNIQMLSVLGLLLAVFQIGSGEYILKTIISLSLLPFIIYMSLSQERSKVKHTTKN